MDKETWGLALSALSIAFAIWAMIIAGGAKKAVAAVVSKSNNQAARDNARDLLLKLNAAVDAATGRRKGASRLSSAGRSLELDKNAVQVAQVALATTVIGSDKVLNSKLRTAATSLDNAINTIDAAGAQDGWADAQRVLLQIVPEVEVASNQLGTKSLV